jgi:hypothetical protein
MSLALAVDTVSFSGPMDQNMPEHRDSRLLDICMRLRTFSLARDTLSFLEKCLL